MCGNEPCRHERDYTIGDAMKSYVAASVLAGDAAIERDALKAEVARLTAEVERLKGGREIEQTMLANVLPTLAANDAENEALRAEVASLRAFQLQHRRSL